MLPKGPFPALAAFPYPTTTYTRQKIIQSCNRPTNIHHRAFGKSCRNAEALELNQVSNVLVLKPWQAKAEESDRMIAISKIPHFALGEDIERIVTDHGFEV